MSQEHADGERRGTVDPILARRRSPVGILREKKDGRSGSISLARDCSRSRWSPCSSADCLSYLYGAHGRIDIHIDMHIDMRIDMCIDMHIGMHIGMHIDMCIDMHIDVHMELHLDMHLDMRIDMHIDMDIDVCIDVCV